MRKHTFARSLLLCLLAALLLFAVACSKEPETPDTETPNTETPNTEQTAGGEVNKTGAWANATYTKDTALGEGAKTVTVKVAAEGQSITFTIRTDKTTLREVMEEHSLVAGSESAYGLMVESVNGMVVKFEDGGYWWGITKAGVTTATGVDGITVADGEQYEFTKTNQY